MPAKLTESQKKARGTEQKSRAPVPRTVFAIRTEISDTEQAVDDLRYVMQIALGEIRKNKVMITTTALDSHGAPVKIRKINPAFKVHKDAMASLRSLKRMLDHLREEESLAVAKEQKESEHEEFADFVTD
jgi:hypothetical protein